MNSRSPVISNDSIAAAVDSQFAVDRHTGFGHVPACSSGLPASLVFSHFHRWPWLPCRPLGNHEVDLRLLAMARMRSILLFALCFVVSGSVLGEPAAGRSLLLRAQTAMHQDRMDGRVLHYRAVAAEEQNYQSDRMYPPYFSMASVGEFWFDPRNGVERGINQKTFPGQGPTAAEIVVTDAERAFRVQQG